MVLERRKYGDLVSTRSIAYAHALTQKNLVPARHGILDFLKLRVLAWAYHYLKSRFGRRSLYQNYSGKDRGVYPLTEIGTEATLAIAADWATGTDESDKIARLM